MPQGPMDPSDRQRLAQTVPSSGAAKPSLANRSGGPFARDRLVGFSILAVAFAGALLISWKSSQSVRPEVAEEPAPPTSDGLDGFPDRIDAVQSLAVAEALTERRQLRRLWASGVASDGSIDLRVPNAGVRYEFDSKRGDGPEPPRPPGTVPRGPYCGRQTVNISPQGIFAEPDNPTARCSPDAGDALPEPRCTLQGIWRTAMARGADGKGRATIEYYRAHGGPAWRFSMPGSSVRFSVYGDCETILTGSQARAKG
jgi:hypothetical protein